MSEDLDSLEWFAIVVSAIQAVILIALAFAC